MATCVIYCWNKRIDKFDWFYIAQNNGCLYMDNVCTCLQDGGMKLCERIRFISRIIHEIRRKSLCTMFVGCVKIPPKNQLCPFKVRYHVTKVFIYDVLCLWVNKDILRFHCRIISISVILQFLFPSYYT